MENDENNGFRMSNILAINRHWYDVLLDYSPKKLSMKLMKFQPYYRPGLKALKQENLNSLTHLKIEVGDLDEQESFDYFYNPKPFLLEVKKLESFFFKFSSFSIFQRCFLS